MYLDFFIFSTRIKIEKNDNGFLAKCPLIEGAFAEGDTEFEAFYNLMDVVRMINEYFGSRWINFVN